MGKNETKNYVGGSGMDDMELDERDIHSCQKKYDRKIRERGSDKDLHGGP